jgi:hypothetical protein
VQRLERRENRERDSDGLGERQRAFRETLGERLPLEQLHDEERLAVVVADVKKLTYVRMGETRRGARLAHEAFARGRVVGSTDGLDRDRATQTLILGGVDDSHPAFAELAHNAIGPDPFEHRVTVYRGVHHARDVDDRFDALVELRRFREALDPVVESGTHRRVEMNRLPAVDDDLRGVPFFDTNRTIAGQVDFPPFDVHHARVVEHRQGEIDTVIDLLARDRELDFVHRASELQMPPGQINAEEEAVAARDVDDHLRVVPVAADRQFREDRFAVLDEFDDALRVLVARRDDHDGVGVTPLDFALQLRRDDGNARAQSARCLLGRAAFRGHFERRQLARGESVEMRDERFVQPFADVRPAECLSTARRRSRWS